MGEAALDELVSNAFHTFQRDLNNRSVSGRTIIGCLTGGFLGLIAGSAIWLLQIFFLGQVYYFSFLLIYVIAYFIIRFLTKQNAANIMVLLTGLLVAMLSTLVPYFLLS